MIAENHLTAYKRERRSEIVVTAYYYFAVIVISVGISGVFLSDVRQSVCWRVAAGFTLGSMLSSIIYGFKYEVYDLRPRQGSRADQMSAVLIAVLFSLATPILIVPFLAPSPVSATFGASMAVIVFLPMFIERRRVAKDKVDMIAAIRMSSRPGQVQCDYIDGRKGGFW